jgi:N-acetylmuramoyl-L-alanine amidase
LAGVAALLLACGEDPKTPATPEPELAVLAMEESELYAYRARELEQMFAGASREVQIDPLARARALTRITRVHARIEGSCKLCVRAVPRVEESLDRAVAKPETMHGACDAALDLMSVLARDSPDATIAIGFAQRWTERFAKQADTAECAAGLRALSNELSNREAAPPSEANSLVIAPPRSRDIALSGEDAARFVTEGSSLAQLLSIERFGAGESPETLPPSAAGRGSQVRVVIALDRSAKFRRGELPAQPDAPRRIVIDFERTAPAPGLADASAIGAAGVTRVRAAALDETTTRVEFDVGEATQYRLFFLPRPYRVVLDFTSTALAAHRDPTIRTIVLDPGHGGVHSGARGPNGVSEAEVALSLALRVRRALARTLPDPRVILTRETDGIVSLEERTAIANAVEADLFVSIHLNASASDKDRGGVSTYVLDATHDAQAIGIAARENEAAVADISALSALFGSLVRRDQVTRSLELAHVVHRAVLRNGRRQLPNLADRGVKPALFYVLVGARMPAILCEASFLTRREEAEALATETYRQLLADGIAEGIARYVRKVERARTVLAESAAKGRP